MQWNTRPVTRMLIKQSLWLLVVGHVFSNTGSDWLGPKHLCPWSINVIILKKCLVNSQSYWWNLLWISYLLPVKQLATPLELSGSVIFSIENLIINPFLPGSLNFKVDTVCRDRNTCVFVISWESTTLPNMQVWNSVHLCYPSPPGYFIDVPVDEGAWWTIIEDVGKYAACLLRVAMVQVLGCTVL